jgi:hypothetical protein
MKYFKKMVNNPYVNIIIGLILLLSGLNEAWETLYEDIMNGHFGVHHGVIIFGLFHALKCIPDIFEGFEDITTKE